MMYFHVSLFRIRDEEVYELQQILILQKYTIYRDSLKCFCKNAVGYRLYCRGIVLTRG